MPIAALPGKLLSRSFKQSVFAAFTLFATVFSLTASAQTGGAYKVTNLVSDGSVPATVTDTNFINPWAISASGTWWISTAGTGYDYVISSTTGAIGFKVVCPRGTPANTANGFPAGCRHHRRDRRHDPSQCDQGVVPLLHARWHYLRLEQQARNCKCASPRSPSTIVPQAPPILASPSSTPPRPATSSPPTSVPERLEVYDSTFKPTSSLAPLPIPAFPPATRLSPSMFSTTRSTSPMPCEPPRLPIHTVDALGNGVVSVFDISGNFIARVATGGNLDSPWGVAFAPASFGIFGGSLLIGNFGNGMINAYDPTTFAYRGQLTDGTGKPLTYASLWELLAGGTAVGNTTSVSGGDPNTVYFTAGLAGEAHGLFARHLERYNRRHAHLRLQRRHSGLTVTDGSSAQTTINIAPTYSFSGTVNFACTGLPVAASCVFSPAQVSAVATAPVSTTAYHPHRKVHRAGQPHSHGVSRIVFAFLLPFVSIPAFYRRRSAHQTGLLRSGRSLRSRVRIARCGDGLRRRAAAGLDSNRKLAGCSDRDLRFCHAEHDDRAHRAISFSTPWRAIGRPLPGGRFLLPSHQLTAALSSSGIELRSGSIGCAGRD